MTSTETGSITRTDFSQNFDYEHQILRDFAVEPQIQSSIERADSSSLEVHRYMQLGHDREAVAMALVAVTRSDDKDVQVIRSNVMMDGQSVMLKCCSCAVLPAVHSIPCLVAMICCFVRF